MSQLWQKTFSGFELANGTANTPLLLFYLEQGLVCSNIYRFVEYTPVDSFEDLLQSGVNAHRQGESQLHCCCRNYEIAYQ